MQQAGQSPLLPKLNSTPQGNLHVASRRRGVYLVSVLSALALAVAACGSGSTSASSTTSGGGGSGQAVKIGVITDNTGPIAAAAQEFDNGGIIAAQEVNKDGFLGNETMQLVSKESGANPATAASDASQLASDSSITGLICCILSPVVGAVKPIAISHKLPTIIWGATDAGLAQPPYVYRTVTMPQAANAALSKQVAHQVGVKTVAYSVMTDNSGIVSQANAFKQGFDAAGVTDLGQVGTLSTQTTFTSTATSLMQKNPQAIVVVATQSVALGVIGALHLAGYKGQVVSGETVAGSGVYQAQPSITNVPFPVYFLASQPSTAAGTQFVKDYVKEFHSQPDDYAAQGFNAVYTMAVALKHAGNSPTRASVGAALGNLKSVPNTIYGTVTFSGGQLDASSSVTAVHYTAPNGDLAPWTGTPLK